MGFLDIVIVDEDDCHIGVDVHLQVVSIVRVGRGRHEEGAIIEGNHWAHQEREVLQGIKSQKLTFRFRVIGIEIES